MHLIITIDLSGEAFQHGNIGTETARILHNSAERLATLHNNYGALTYENPEQLYLLDNTGSDGRLRQHRRDRRHQPGRTGPHRRTRSRSRPLSPPPATSRPAFGLPRIQGQAVDATAVNA